MPYWRPLQNIQNKTCNSMSYTGRARNSYSHLFRSEWSQNIEPFQLSATLKQGAPPKVTSANQAPRSANH